MDAFVVRKRRAPDAQLFDRDAFLFVPLAASGTEPEGDEAAAKAEVTALVTSNGGRVLDVESDLSESRELVALLLTTDLRAADPEMLARLLRSHPSAVVMRAQWVRDCAAQQTRLAMHAYEQTRAARAMLLHVEASPADASNASEADSSKRRRLEADAASTSEPTALPTPHLTPWRGVAGGSLLILDARTAQQQQQQEEEATNGGGGAPSQRKIAGFDMDGTLIDTKSGKRFAKDASDWKWLHPSRVRAKLQDLVRAGFELVVFSNQNGIAAGHVTVTELQAKVEAIVKSLNLPVLVILATRSDRMRKPRLGGWHEMLQVLGLDAAGVDMDASFYCGDAAGRPKIAGRAKDFAATDYKFALNLKLQFHTPEALFLASTQRVHTHLDMWEIGFDPRPLALNNSFAATAAWLAPPTAELAKTTQEVVVLVGPPASGKSFFSKTRFPGYVVINQDELRTLANCKKHCLDALAQQKSVVIDSTNRDTRSRGEWMVLAREQNVPVRCFEMDVEKALSMHLNTFRSLTEEKKIPDIAIHTFYKNFVPPQAHEGFAEIVKDAEFLQLNGIAHIVNCVPRHVPNLFQQSLGLSYTACDLDEVLRRPLFDLKNREFMNLVQLIDKALEKTESVLVHSLNGLNRSPSLMIGYLMVKYCWGVDKAYDFMVIKRGDIKLDESYAEQLCLLEAQLQKTYPARATEQQMFEWSPSSADRKTDELVLVHTYLNATAKANAGVEHPVKKASARAHRRLSWIDESAQMKKLHPSLMAKPERPPNHSYNAMHPVRRNARDMGDAQLLRSNGNARLQSFSLPKKKEAELEAAVPPQSPTSSDRDDLEVTYEYTGSSKFPKPRYLQETLASINSRPRKPSFRAPMHRAPSYSAPSSKTALPMRADTTPVFTKTMASTALGNHADTHAPKGKKPLNSMTPAHKSLAGRTPRASSAATNSASSSAGRALFAADFSQPMTSVGIGASTMSGGLGGSFHRSFAEPSDAGGTCYVRPRTAPPRMRKKDIDTSDLLSSKRMDTSARVQAGDGSQQPPSRRARSSLDAVGSTTATATANSTSSATGKASSSRRSSFNTASVSASYSRAKATRAQWK
ncbi:hypothetical protein PybrP1_009089 [[Pythium] brassicae (nom. inval.)]|nr:hypothetical protein PybrP1_009089 [[Pythium] brassicae (nom. inval.)]